MLASSSAIEDTDLMLYPFQISKHQRATFCCATVLCALLADYCTAQAPKIESTQPQQEEADRQKKENRRLHMVEHLAPELIRADLEQFRKVLKSEWLVATLSESDFDAAITDLAERSADGMSRSELLFELQRILALGSRAESDFRIRNPEAEPGIYPVNVPEFPKEHFYHYAPPVVVLLDHRVFSSGDLLVAGLEALDNVTLVGSRVTAAGGTAPEVSKLEKSGLEFMLGSVHSGVRQNGDFIDGKGIQPDIVAPADVDVYLGRRDRVLETAIDVLKKRNATEH